MKTFVLTVEVTTDKPLVVGEPLEQVVKGAQKVHVTKYKYLRDEPEQPKVSIDFWNPTTQEIDK